ncbi:MAG: metallophosphoesterase, partial [Anaerolineae bacterium]
MPRKSFSLIVLTLAGLLAFLIAPALTIPVAAQASEDFTIIVLPDTQYYSDDDPETIFQAQTQWIVDNQAALNIVYVAHEGDLVQTASDTDQWDNADAAMDLLDSAEIPYGVLPGNHDQYPMGNPAGTANYNIYFGVDRFSGKPYYGGHYGTDNDNNYALFTAGGMDFIVINLEYNLESAAITWADDLLTTYGDRRAIVVSHSILGYPPSGSSIAPFTTIGQNIYNGLRDNENLFLMLCGHNHAEGRRTDVYNGDTIYSLLADYQDLPDGGDGWLRIMTFSPADDEITVTTYSPTLGLYGEDTVMGN